MDSPHSQPSASATNELGPVTEPAADEEIYCPFCNYNLTGVQSDRCPECGAIFDRTSLLRARQAHQITLIPWDDPEPMTPFERFRATLTVTLLQPKKLAYAFSVQPRKSRAVSFALLVALIAASATLGLTAAALVLAVAVGPDTVFGDLGAHLAVIAVAIPLSVGASIALTTLLAALALYVLCPHFDGHWRFKPWLSITAYASAHFLLSLPALPFIHVFTFRYSYEFPGAVLVGWMVCWVASGLLAFFTLVSVVEHRAGGDRRPWVINVVLLLIFALAPVLVQFVTIGLTAAISVMLSR